jgi:hypothetical protein
MMSLTEIKNTIEGYEEERILMNVQQLDRLLTHATLEQSQEVKTHILTIIEKYLDVLKVSDIVVAEPSAPVGVFVDCCYSASFSSYIESQ